MDTALASLIQSAAGTGGTHQYQQPLLWRGYQPVHPA